MISVVVADDEKTIRRGLIKALEGLDMALAVIGEARDGEEALELVKKTSPDVILLDINMPKMNGLDFAKELKDNGSGTKIIMVTGYDDYEYIRTALKIGVFDYILKPVNQGVLMTVLKEVSEAIEKERNPIDFEFESEDIVGVVLKEIENRYADQDLRLSVLSDQLYVSTASLSRGIKKRTGKTFSDYLTELRVQKAKEILGSGRDVMIYSVAERVGYSSQHYFCRIFKEYTGYTPSAYAQMKRKDFTKNENNIQRH